MISSTCNALRGTRAYELVANSVIGGAPVNGTFKRGFEIGGGNGIAFSWGGPGASNYKIGSNAVSGDLELAGTGDVSNQALIKVNWNLSSGRVYKINGVQVVGSRLGAIASPTADVASLKTAVDAIRSALSTHGLTG